MGDVEYTYVIICPNPHFNFPATPQTTTTTGSKSVIKIRGMQNTLSITTAILHVSSCSPCRDSQAAEQSI